MQILPQNDLPFTGTSEKPFKSKKILALNLHAQQKL